MMNIRLHGALNSPGFQRKPFISSVSAPTRVNERSAEPRFQGESWSLWKIATAGLLPLALLTSGCSSPTDKLEQELRSIPYTQDAAYVYPKLTDKNEAIRLWAVNKLQPMEMEPHLKLMFALEALRDKDNTVVVLAANLIQHLSESKKLDTAYQPLLQEVLKTYPHFAWVPNRGNCQIGDYEAFYPAWTQLKTLVTEQTRSQLAELKVSSQMLQVPKP